MMTTKFNIRQYQIPGRAALLTNVPIEFYDRDTMTELRKYYGMPVRVWFRGPRRRGARSLPAGGVYRIGQSICLRKDAKTFSVYYR